MNKSRNMLSLAAMTLSLFASCAALSTAAVAQDELKVGMEITYPPFESYDDNQKVVGVDPELIAAIAKQMGKSVTFVDTKFPNLINGLDAGHFDVVISGMYVTEERKAKAQAIAYGQVGASVLAARGSDVKISKPEDLCGMKLGLLQASAWVAQFRDLSTDYCEKNGKKALTVSEYPSAPEVTQALLSRNVEVQVEMGPAADQIIQATGQRLTIVSDKQIYPQTLGLYVKKDNAVTYKAVNDALEALKADGEYAAILKKYNLEPLAK
jgi:polar amino acid transport system substrate-binding protein